MLGPGLIRVSLLDRSGMFLTLFLLYLRLFPAVSIAEVKPVLHVGYDEKGGHH